MKHHNISRVRYFIFENKIPIALLQLVFTTFAAFVGVPVVRSGFSLTLKKVGYSTVTKENFFDILFRWPSMVYLLVVLCAVVLLMLLNITMYEVWFDKTLAAGRTSIFGYIIQVIRFYLQFVFSKKILRIFYMVPFAVAVYMPAFILIMYNNAVSRYFLKYCIKSIGWPAFVAVILLIYVLCIAVFIRKLPYIKLSILYKDMHKRVAARSKVRGKLFLRRAFFQWLWGLGILLICAIIYLTIIGLSILLLKLFSNSSNMLVLFYESYNKVCAVVAFLLSVVCGALNISSTMQMAKSRGMGRLMPKTELRKETYMVVLAIFVIICVVAAVANVRYFVAGYSSTKASLGEVTVTAHRGVSAEAPENTLPAIELAIEKGADYVEIDVRLTADGEIVLMHDKNTKRTSGESMIVEESTYEELLALDVGSWFSEEYEGTPIPTLAEVLELCKGKIIVNIEVKTTSKKGTLEKKVAELITDMGMEEWCVVTSFKQRVLKKIKKYNKNIITGYIYNIGYSNDIDYDCMDILSINSEYLTKSMVVGAHKKGIQVHAWTVNTKANVRRMIAIGVDNIITDDVDMTKEVALSTNSGGLSDILQYIFQ